jgi:hypothetical protein
MTSSKRSADSVEASSETRKVARMARMASPEDRAAEFSAVLEAAREVFGESATVAVAEEDIITVTFLPDENSDVTAVRVQENKGDGAYGWTMHIRDGESIVLNIRFHDDPWGTRACLWDIVTNLLKMKGSETVRKCYIGGEYSNDGRPSDALKEYRCEVWNMSLSELLDIAYGGDGEVLVDA